MHFNNPKFEPTGAANTLAVMLHAYRSTRANMANAIEAVSEAYEREGGVDIYAPTLPYSHWCDPTGANRIVVKLVGDLDEIWGKHKYDRVIFIGHSLGGILVRRVFLAGAPNPPDYAGNYVFRDDLPESVTGEWHDWSARVERIVLLASWDKGWSISARDAWRYSFGLNILGLWGRVAELVGFKSKPGPRTRVQPWRRKVAKFVAFESKPGPGTRVQAWRRKVAELVEFGAKPGRTMLDTRLGAPFIVQTRLLWMAYRRWHNPSLRNLYNNAHPMTRLDDPEEVSDAVNPLVIQIIGTRDDFVSPQDQVDYVVEAAENAAADNAAQKIAGDPAQPAKTYFLLEMPGADHAGVVDFKGAGRDGRKSVFLCALTGGAPFLSQCAGNRKPAYFEDLPTKPDPTVKDVVFVMHGIRDVGYWTHRIAKAVKEAADAIAVKAKSGQQVAADRLEPGHFESWAQTYGYFPMGAFLLPWIRQQKVEWYMDQYVGVKARYPNATMHYVGHSHGTYLAASALEDYAAARFGKIYFAGSVVKPKFDWSGRVEQKRVKRLHNARGATDWVVALLPKSIEYFADLGGAGFDGFELAPGSPAAITQSQCYAKGGHSGAIGEGHWPEIANFIVTGEKPFASGEPTGSTGLFEVDQNRWLKFFASFRIGIPLAFSLVALLVLLGFSLWLPSGHWQWGAINGVGGWGWAIWGTALTAFLALQYLSKQAPLRPSSPRPWNFRNLTHLVLPLQFSRRERFSHSSASSR